MSACKSDSSECPRRTGVGDAERTERMWDWTASKEAVAAEKGEKNVLVAMGRYFTSNPDLPKRWMKGVALTKYDRSTFYTQGAKGYNDWAESQEDVAL